MHLCTLPGLRPASMPARVGIADRFWDNPTLQPSLQVSAPLQNNHTEAIYFAIIIDWLATCAQHVKKDMLSCHEHPSPGEAKLWLSSRKSSTSTFPQSPACLVVGSIL